MERIAVAKRSATKLVSTTSRSDKAGLLVACTWLGALNQGSASREVVVASVTTTEDSEQTPRTHRGRSRPQGRAAGERGRGEQGRTRGAKQPQGGRSKKPLGTYYNRHLLPAMSSDFLHAPSAVRANHRQSRRRPNELPIVMCLPQKTKP